MTDKSFLIVKAILKYNFYLLNEWLEEHRDAQPNEMKNSIYHYASIDTCSKIINSDDLRLYDAKFCNDEQEYEIGKGNVQNFFNRIDKNFKVSNFKNNEDEPYQRHEYSSEQDNIIFDELLGNYSKYNPNWLSYIACFSSPTRVNEEHLLPNDNLAMWRGYAKNGQGACLSFSRVDLEDHIENVPNLLMLDVLYEEYQKAFFIKSLYRLAYDMNYCTDTNNNALSSYMLAMHIKTNIGNVSKKQLVEAFSLAFRCIPSFFKHEGFKEENEIRLVYIPNIHTKYDERVSYLGTGNRARPYINLSSLMSDEKSPLLPISEITFGPDSCNQSYKDEFLMTNGTAVCLERGIRESFSKIPYRSTT